MRLMVLTILFMGGAVLSTEYALLDARKVATSRMEAADDEDRQLSAAFRQTLPPELARDLGHARPKLRPTGRVAALVDLHDRDPKTAIWGLLRIDSPRSIEALTQLHRDAGSPAVLDHLLQLANSEAPEAPRARDLHATLAKPGR